MNFTDREKQLLLSNAPVLSRITLYDEDGSVLQVFNEDDYIVDWELEDYRYVPDQGFVGQFVERLLDGNFMNIPDELSLEDKEIEVEIAVVDNELEEQVYHNYGRFVITKIEKGDVSGSYKFESSDYAKKFNVPITGTISYPCTSLELLNNVCEIAGVELDTNGECLSFCVPKDGLTAGTYYFAVTDDAGTTTNYEFELDTNVRFHDTLMLILDENKLILKTIDDDYKINRRELTYATVETSSGTLLNENLIGYVDFINNDFVVEDNQFEEQDSCRTVVSSIAKLGYTWARINENNKLCLDFVKNEDVDSYDEIDTDKYYEARVTGDKVEPVNKVLIGMSNVDGENIVKEQDTDLLRVNKISGETSQESYSGKNLIGLVDGDYSANGITIKVVDGVLYANGTADAATNAYIPLVNDFVMPPNTTYTFRASLIGGSVQSAGNIAARLLTSTSGGNTFINYSTLDNYVSGTVNNQQTFKYVLFYINPNKSTTNAKIGYQLELGSAPTDYERYVGGESSPNPYYPQEVNSVKGGNNLLITGKSILKQGNIPTGTNTLGGEPGSTSTRGGLLYTRNDDLSVTISGTATSDSATATMGIGKIGLNNWANYNNAYILPAGTYKVVWETQNSSKCLIGMWKYDKYGNYLGGQVLRGRGDTNKFGYSTLTTDGVTVTAIGVYADVGDTISNTVRLMVVKNDVTDYTYEPYQEITKSFNLPVENLFDGNISQGCWTSSVNTIISSEPEKRGFRNTNPIYIKPNTNYVISGTIPADTSTIWLVETDEDGLILPINGNNGFKEFVHIEERRSSMVLKTHINAKKLYWYSVGTNVTNYPTDFMVEEGTKLDTYTPYGTTPIELCKIGDYQDRIYYDNGDWYLHKEIEKIVLNESESYTLVNQVDGNYMFRTNTTYNLPDYYTNYLSNYFTVNTAGYSTNTIGSYFYSNTFRMRVPSTIATNGTEWATWLSTNNVVVYYKQPTPTNTKITYQPLIDQLNELDKIGLFKGINYITTNTLNEIPTLDITTTNLEQEETNYSDKSFEIIGHDYSNGGTINVFDNPLTHSEELRRIAINGSENLLGLTYTPMEVESIGHPWLNGKEYMKVTNLEDNDLYFYPFDRKMKYNGALTTDLSAEAKDDTSQKYQNKDNVIDRLHHTEIDVDKANQQITSLVQEVSDTNDKMTKVTQDVNSVSTQVESINKSVDDNTKNIATIQQTIAGLSVETSITGGTNLIKNSVGYFGNDFWMVNDDTEGNVKTMNDNDVKNNSISANALLLQNETIYQKITEIKNGSYYISFRYKRLLTTATCKLIINGEEFNLTSTSWKDEGKEIPVTSNNIQISLVSNKNGSCLVTDLIVSNGTSKVSWTQNANETFTDGVKIGKGITITATGSDTELSATASSIDIVNTRNRESTSTFDKYGIKTNSLESKGTIRVADKLIISRVGDQMWISTL